MSISACRHGLNEPLSAPFRTYVQPQSAPRRLRPCDFFSWVTVASWLSQMLNPE
jgi:hypothetical protein